MLYVTETKDEKQAVRNRLFVRWFNKYELHHQYVIRIAQGKMDGQMNFMAIILRKDNPKLQMAIGSDFAHPEMVFTSATGNYKDRSSLNTSLKRFLKGTDFEYLTLHKLRHTNATLLLNNGVDLKIVSDHLGHADIQITADTYTAVLNSSKKKTAELMEQILTEQTPNKHQMLGIG